MIAFASLSIVLVASALWTIAARKPVYSVVALLVHFAALAGLYLTLGAEFLAVIQIIVYSGAILMLFLFVIALLSSGVAPFSVGPDRMPKAALPATVIAVIGLGLLLAGLLHAPPPSPAAPAVAGVAAGPVGAPGVFGSVAEIGRALFTTYLLPFEITAFILVVAIVGVLALAGDAGTARGTLRRAERVRRAAREAIMRGGE
jgi:NADH-quinone oxidoreductase subunit J